MELIYLLIFFISCLIEDIDNVLLKKTDMNAIKDEKILHVSEEPSLLQCAQRCRFIDKNSIVDFKNSKCTCVKYEVDEEQEHQGTLTGVFVNQKIMRAKKLELPRTTKLPESTKPASHFVNIALNKPTSQSSTDNYWRASNGNDGDKGTPAITRKEKDPWWRVDLGSDVNVDHFVFYADAGAFNSKFYKGVVVTVAKSTDFQLKVCKDLGDLKDLVTRFSCDSNEKFRFLVIQSTGITDMRVKELEVYVKQ